MMSMYMSFRNPDIAKCRASHSGEGGLIFCLNEDDRFLCDYCLPFGETYYCRHPKCHEIAERTDPRKMHRVIPIQPIEFGLKGA